jgi:hypothetical protein
LGGRGHYCLRAFESGIIEMIKIFIGGEYQIMKQYSRIKGRKRMGQRALLMKMELCRAGFYK